MTGDELARSYLLKARKRLRAIEVLLEEEDFSDVIREAQEVVELALKAMLRMVGIDPPRWHDVGGILLEHEERFPRDVGAKLRQLARVSKWLRRERELAFYGDVDFIPTEEYTRGDALKALEGAHLAVETAEGLLEALYGGG